MQPPKAKPGETLVYKPTQATEDAIHALRQALRAEGQALGALFVMGANGDSGLLFAEDMPKQFRLSMLHDMLTTVENTRKYFAGVN